MPGYKHSDVGVIPDDWDAKAIGEEIDLLTGFPFPSSGYSKSGVRLLRGSNIKRGQTDWSDDIVQYWPEVSRELARYSLQVGDLVVSMDGSLVGRSFAQLRDSDLPALLLQRVARIRGKKMDVTYLRQFVGSDQFIKYVDSVKTVTAIPHISPGDIRRFTIPVPPTIEEQRAIAQALSDVDALLATLDQMIAKKRDLKQAAMQQLLTGKTRLPGFSGKWEARTLFELAECKKEFFDDGDWIESEHITTEGIRLIQTGNIGIGSFVEKEDKKYINEASFSSLRCKQLKQGDLLVCRLAEPAGRACVLGDIGEERIVTSVDVTIFRPPPELADRTFLVQAFSTADWFRAVSDRSGGTTHKRISRGALGRLSINLPPVPEQSAIARVLSDMDADLSALEARRDKTRNIKQAMMQELLTGKTRLV